MRIARAASWQPGIARSRAEKPQLWQQLEALYAPVAGVTDFNTAAAQLPDIARGRNATYVGTASQVRTVLGPAASMLGSGSRFAANNTANKHNYIHQTARFSATFLLRLSVVGVTHILLDNNLSQTVNVGLSLFVNGAARASVLVTRGVTGQPVISLTGTTVLLGNTIYLVTVTSDGITAKL